ncbi:MAG: pentapeptide repeat-containing protein [Rivularia sp. (in: cyanobacteria)]
MPADYSSQNLRGRSFKGQNLEGANFSYADIRGTNFTEANLREANFTGAKAGLQKSWALNSFLKIVLLTFSILIDSISLTVSMVGFVAIYTTFIASKYAATKAGKNNKMLLTVASAFTIAGLIALVLALFLSISLTGNISISVLKIGLLPIAIGLLGLTYVAVVGSDSGIISTARNRVEAGFIPLLIAVADEFIKNTIVNTGGTSFHMANLTEANFQQATLKNTDFGSANVTRTIWFRAKKLDRARVGNTYFQNPKVRELLVTKQGQNKIFDYQNLRGVNLQEANLVGASFIGADLSEANLQDADLSRAILKQAQLDGTNFTGATLTGAIIEDWNITHETNFRGVKCEYVYMRLPTKENPNPLRKPDNNAEVFADGEFGDFIQPIFDTLDLYHNQGVDPRAIAISFKELAENNPDAELEIVAMEKRGEDKFLLRAKVAPEVTKSELSAEYFETYNYLKSLNPSEQVQYLLTELKVKDAEINSQQNQISSYENMINTALGRPSIQADTVNTQQIGGNINNNDFHKQNQKQTENSTVKTILILASNPKNTSQLRLGEEVREIDAGLQRAKKRELFDFKQRWAVRCQEVYQAFLDFKPQIVHFSGHGSGDNGLALEDENGNLKLVDTEAIAKLFELFSDTIECVVLNACYSEVQASAIAKYIPYVIGMNQAIGDKAAIKFATGFYNALGAGENIEFAYKLGCNVIQLDGIPEHLTPVLKKRQGDGGTRGWGDKGTRGKITPNS